MTDQNAFSPADPIKAWKDLQENWATALKEMTNRATEMAGTPMTPVAVKKFTDAWIDNQRKFIEQGMMMNKLFPSPELADRFQNATKMYLESYRWWADALGKAADGAAPAGVNEAVTQMWKQAYQSFVEPIVSMPWMNALQGMPGMQGTQIPSMFPGMPPFDPKSFSNLPGQTADALMEMQRNWQEMVDRATKQAIDGIEEGGPEIMKEFYASWAKGYEMTVGKVVQIPPIGPAREGIELYQRSLDSYLKLCGAAFDFYLRTTKPSLDAFVSVSNEAHEMMKKEVTPETFQKLYSMTIAEFETRLHDLFSADEFVKTLKTTLETSLTFQKDYQEFLEANLKGTPVITRTEMDEVHEELYNMRQQIKALKKAIAELENKS